MSFSAKDDYSLELLLSLEVAEMLLEDVLSLAVADMPDSLETLASILHNFSLGRGMSKYTGRVKTGIASV